MIADQFDTLSKALRPETRRQTLRRLAGVPLSGALTVVLPTAQRARAKKPGGKHHRKPRHKRHPVRTQPDPRVAAIAACRAKHGVPVEGECDCAFIGNGQQSDFPCPGIAACSHGAGVPPGRPVCTMTLDGTGFCADAPFGERGCNQSAPCDPRATCVILPDPTCQGHCTPPTS